MKIKTDAGNSAKIFFRQISWVAWTAVAVCAAGWFLFLKWMVDSGEEGVIRNLLPMLSLAMLCAVCVLLVPQIEQLLRVKATVIERETPAYVYSMVILWTVGMFTFIAAYAARQNGGDIFSAVDGFKLGGTDVPHYSNIAENWYRNDGTDNRFMIVFFPLFPLLLKIAKSAVQSYVWSALLINAVLAVFSGIGFYKLSGLVLKKRNVNRAVKMLYIFPAAFFFYIPMTEALFMACTVYFFLFLVKRKYLWVFVFGFLAALTRIQGILLLVPFIAEIIREFLPSEDRQEAKPGVIKILAGFGAPLGFGVYLMINFMVYGDAFQYMAYQREHWYQSASYFWNTVSYLQNYGAGYLQEKSYGYFLSLSLPALVTAFGSLTLLLIGAKKRLRLSLMMYAVVYFVVSYAPTWLLSGPRYMMCCFPLAMIAGTALDGHKRAERVLSVFYLAAYFLYLHMFLTRYPVY